VLFFVVVLFLPLEFFFLFQSLTGSYFFLLAFFLFLPPHMRTPIDVIFNNEKKHINHQIKVEILIASEVFIFEIEIESIE